jgi:hypothetical protein
MSSRRHVEMERVGRVSRFTFTDRTLFGGSGEWFTHDVIEPVSELGLRNVLLDFTNIESVYDPFFDRVIALYRIVHQAQGNLVLCRMQPNIRDAFRVPKVARILTIATDPNLADLHWVTRDIFGHPPGPPLLASDWRTDTVLALARQIYDSHDCRAMPILADALQDAGCDSDEVLNHCRGEGPHVRGCWVVDLVLGLS